MRIYGFCECGNYLCRYNAEHCSKCYQNSRKGKIRKPQTKERFMTYVKKTSMCWIWIYHKDSKGYGCIWWNFKKKLAHRLSWELFKGPIPKGKFVCHQCDNPICVKPSHLWIGTAKDNAEDMVKKGRQGIRNLHRSTILFKRQPDIGPRFG